MHLTSEQSYSYTEDKRDHETSRNVAHMQDLFQPNMFTVQEEEEEK